MFDQITTQLLVLAFALLPLSLLIIRATQKFLSSYHPDLSATTTICSSIEGSLTSNTWLVKTILFGNTHLELDENQRRVYFENYKTREEKELARTDLSNFKEIKDMLKITKLCKYEKAAKFEDIILKFLGSCGINSSFLHDKHLKIEAIPNNDKKFSTFIYQDKESHEIFAFCKGNPQSLLEQCSRAIIDGKKVEIDHPLKRKFKKRIKILNKRGEKVIAFAYKGLPKKRLDHYKESYVENDLILIGMIGIGDYPNKQLLPIIKEIRELGIKHFILSSARERRAIAIAKELKVVNPLHFESITGSMLEDISKAKLKKILGKQEKNHLFSELSPEQKTRIIESLRDQGENIAISKADKQSSLKTILQCIKDGRQNENTKAKISSHAISCKIAQIILIINCIALKVPLALGVVSIIALDISVNLILEISLKRDTSEGAKAELRQSRIIMNGIMNGIFLSLIYVWSLMRFGWHPFSETPLSSFAINSSATLVFLLLSIMQIANAYNIKHSKESIFKLKNLSNIYLALSSLAVILVLYILSKFELLGLAKVNQSEIILITFISLLLVLFEEIRKFIHNVLPQD